MSPQCADSINERNESGEDSLQVLFGYVGRVETQVVADDPVESPMLCLAGSSCRSSSMYTLKSASSREQAAVTPAGGSVSTVARAR